MASIAEWYERMAPAANTLLASLTSGHGPGITDVHAVNDHPPLLNLELVRARALFVGERLNLRVFDTASRLAVSPLTVRAGERGLAVLFRYGVVVLFELGPVEEVAFLASLGTVVNEPIAAPETEDVQIRVRSSSEEGIDNGVIELRQMSVDRLQIVADILAKSVVLAHHEKLVAEAFDRVEPLAANLAAKVSRPRRVAELLSHIGNSLLVQHKIVGRVEVEEKPDILWEHPELERLYQRLDTEYELRERHNALERKLALISRTAEILLDVMQTKRGLRVEWYIVILIVVEIMLTVYSMFGA